MSSSEFSIKQTHQNTFNEYALTSILFTYDEIQLDIENTVTKHKYSFLQNAKDILELTKLAKFEMEAEQLYNLYLMAVNKRNNNVQMTIELDSSIASLVLKINWTIKHDEMKLVRTFKLTCGAVPQTDTERMEKMFTDFVKHKEALEKTIEELKKVDSSKKTSDIYDYINSESESQNKLMDKKINDVDKKIVTVYDYINTENDSLWNRVSKRMDTKINDFKIEVSDALTDVNQGQNNIVNVTVFSDMYKSKGSELFKMVVNKKSSMSKLFVTAQMIIETAPNINTAQPNQIGRRISLSEIMGRRQLWTFSGNSVTNFVSPLKPPHDCSLLCMTLIEEHRETGPQTLTFTLPDTQYIESHHEWELYCSVKVEEIM